MGVHGLWKLLEPVARPIKIETLEGKRLAIDSSIWLYQFQASMKDKTGRTLINAHILGFLRRINKLLYHGIKPVFVFDGGAPALKRNTIHDRKMKKAGGTVAHAKVAQQILNAELRKEAMKAAGARRRLKRILSDRSDSRGASDRGSPYPHAADHGGDEQVDDGEAINQDGVFLDDYDRPDGGVAPRRAARRRHDSSSSSSSRSASPDPKEASAPAKKKYIAKDIYQLPDLPNNGSMYPADGRLDARLATEEELKDFIDEGARLEDVDTGSAEFKALPMETQYEIINDLRLRSRSSNHARLSDMLSSSKTALDFSKAQILNLQHRNKLTQEMWTLAGLDMTELSINVRMRLGNERGKEYVLMKNDGKKGGWVLGVREQGTAGAPIALEEDDDGTEAIRRRLMREDTSEVQVISGPSSSSAVSKKGRIVNGILGPKKKSREDEQEEAEMEARRNAPGVDPELRDHRRNLALEALAKRYSPVKPAVRPAPKPSQTFGPSRSANSAPLFDMGYDEDLEEDEAADLERVLEASRRDVSASNGLLDLEDEIEDGQRGPMFDSSGDEMEEVNADEEAPPVIQVHLLPVVARHEHEEESGSSDVEIVEKHPASTGSAQAPRLVQASPKPAPVLVFDSSDDEEPAVLPSLAAFSSKPSSIHASVLSRVVPVAAPIEIASDPESDMEELATVPVHASTPLLAPSLAPRSSPSEAPAPPPAPPARPRSSLSIAGSFSGGVRPPTSTSATTSNHSPRAPASAAARTAVSAPTSSDSRPPATAAPASRPVARQASLESRSIPPVAASVPPSPEAQDAVELSSRSPSPRSTVKDLAIESDEEMVEVEPPRIAASAKGKARDASPRLPPAPPAAPTPRSATRPPLSAVSPRVSTNASRSPKASPRKKLVLDSDDSDAESWPAASRPPRQLQEDPWSDSDSATDLIAQDAHEEPPSDAEDDDLEEEVHDVDIDREEDDYARFMSQVKGKNLDSAQEELDEDLRRLRAQQKKMTRDGDENITAQMTGQIQVLLRLYGIPYVTAPMEAEAQCAELAALNLVDGIITDDSDVFLFGGKQCFKNLFNDSKYVECYVALDLERELCLTRERLVSLAFLLGSDYTSGLDGVGYVTGLEVMAEFPGSGDDGLVAFREWWMKVQTGDDDDDDTDTKWKRSFKKKFTGKLHLTRDFPNPRVRPAYFAPEVDSSEEPFAWGLPNLAALQTFLADELGWAVSKVDHEILPIIQRLTRRSNGLHAGVGNQGTLDQYFDTSGGSSAIFAPKVRTNKPSGRMAATVKRFRAAMQKVDGGEQGGDRVVFPSSDEEGSDDDDEAERLPAKKKQRQRAPAKKTAAGDAVAKTATRGRGPGSRGGKTTSRGRGAKKGAAAPRKTKKVTTPLPSSESDADQPDLELSDDHPSDQDVVSVVSTSKARPKKRARVVSADEGEDEQEEPAQVRKKPRPKPQPRRAKKTVVEEDA